MKGIVYGLVASDEPIHIRYIGETRRPKARLRDYLRPTSNATLAVRKWIKSVIERKATIQMVVLGEYTKGKLPSAERKWISFYRNYCHLLNFDLMEGH